MSSGILPSPHGWMMYTQNVYTQKHPAANCNYCGGIDTPGYQYSGVDDLKLRMRPVIRLWKSWLSKQFKNRCHCWGSALSRALNALRDNITVPRPGFVRSWTWSMEKQSFHGKQHLTIQQVYHRLVSLSESIFTAITCCSLPAMIFLCLVSEWVVS